ncbi:N-acetylmuramoyl-L-alanine amidase [Peribacillus frigoritolerans]|uniref:N-acetylmuramoyl-L-alanine amidase n=1 Tax=Peribacillus frigoritolerans TaxID=450367 RepID=UPI0022806EE5|nr:N-acetylmuramoyl-L-alanine amidase [Peribacillus frigoritolerans]MCY9003268.1 N-acetylmuramoyl-L-alanine amidase [Peribacillus frigoritolerans]
MTKIFIDPGHGGKDPGAVGNGLKEKDITLKIANKVKSMLEGYKDVSVKMSRTGDAFPSLSARTKAANEWGANIFLSIHINAGGGTGYEDYVYTSASSKAKEYQSTIHAEIMRIIDMKDRGKKSANYQVLRTSSMPAVLTESGFIDNAGDAAKLKTSVFIEKLAKGHVNGLVKAFNLKKKAAAKNVETSTSYTIVKGDTLYSIAKKFGTTVDILKSLNTTVKPHSLQLGQKLVVSGSTATYHTVVKGDTVSALAAKYRSTIKHIKEWNKLDYKYTIDLGEKIRVK